MCSNCAWFKCEMNEFVMLANCMTVCYYCIQPGVVGLMHGIKLAQLPVELVSTDRSSVHEQTWCYVTEWARV